MPQTVRIGAAVSMCIALSAWAAQDVRADECENATNQGLREVSARALYDRAVEEEPSNPEDALAKYHCVQRVVDRPAVALRIGTVAERLGKRDEAIRAFEHYLVLSGADASDAADMQRHIERLRQERDAPPPKPPPPVIVIQPAHTTKASPVGVVVVISGAAIAAAGSIFLAVAKSENDNAHGAAPGTPWDSGPHGNYDDATRNQTIGVVGLISGGAIAIAGAVLMATLRSDMISTSAKGFEVRF